MSNTFARSPALGRVEQVDQHACRSRPRAASRRPRGCAGCCGRCRCRARTPPPRPAAVAPRARRAGARPPRPARRRSRQRVRCGRCEELRGPRSSRTWRKSSYHWPTARKRLRRQRAHDLVGDLAQPAARVGRRDRHREHDAAAPRAGAPPASRRPPWRRWRSRRRRGSPSGRAGSAAATGRSVVARRSISARSLRDLVGEVRPRSAPARAAPTSFRTVTPSSPTAPTASSGRCGRADLAHQHDVQRRAERGGDLGRDRHAAARQADHERVARHAGDPAARPAGGRRPTRSRKRMTSPPASQCPLRRPGPKPPAGFLAGHRS